MEPFTGTCDDFNQVDCLTIIQAISGVLTSLSWFHTNEVTKNSNARALAKGSGEGETAKKPLVKMMCEDEAKVSSKHCQ